ncbi:MAG TPA: hypothetical protein VGE41_10770 [Verrucomicrobiae bacterium]|jgi:hypothetical protein
MDVIAASTTPKAQVECEQAFTLTSGGVRQSLCAMNSGISWRGVLATFLAVAAAYFLVFYGLEYWRHRKGPWEITFSVDGEGNPSIVIDQPKLSISSVELLFPGAKWSKSNLTEHIAFDRPRKQAPFGKVVYEDLTVLPGVITFSNLFGHVIEIFPRAFSIDRKEYLWKSEITLELPGTNKLVEPNSH